MDPALFAENERTAPASDARRYARIGDVTTEGGATIPDLTVAYEEWGSQENPTILVLHALTGDSHATDERGGGWWGRLVGPGRAMDTDRYRVLCANVLGGCQGTTGPTSPFSLREAEGEGDGGGTLKPLPLAAEGGRGKGLGMGVTLAETSDRTRDRDPSPSGESPLRQKADGGELATRTPGQRSSPRPRGEVPSGEAGGGTPRTADGAIPYGSRFPEITVGDMVDVQARLLDHLGVERLHAVAGGSMGGMQAIEWPLRHPERVERVFATASAPRHSAMQIGFNEVGRQAIFRDPRWKNGDFAEGEEPVDGLAIARMIGHLTFLSSEAFDAKFGRRPQRDEAGSEFAVESYLRHQGDKFTRRFDARSLVTLTRAIDAYDRRSFAGSMARYLSVGFTSDWIYPMSGSEEIARLARAAGCEATHVPIALPYGHDAFLLDGELQADALREFLS